VPNRPIKKGDELFKIDPMPYQIAVSNFQASVLSLREQLKSSQAADAINRDKLALAQKRVGQYTELAASGAGNKFDEEQTETDVLNLQSQIASAAAAEDSIRAQIASSQAQLANAQWELSQTVFYAPANGTVVGLTLRPGAMAVTLPINPAMNFIEDEQWILAIYNQNEVRKIKPGQEAEIAFKMYPGRIVKCKVDSIMWATAQGQLPIGAFNTAGGVAPIPPYALAVRLIPEGKDQDIFLASGARGAGAVFTDSGEMIHILRKVLIRVSAKLDWLILKLH
jgi:multidrug resistance efflux pump